MHFSGCPIPQLRLSDFVHCRCIFGMSDPTTQTVRFCSLRMHFSGCPIPQLRLSDFVHCRCIFRDVRSHNSDCQILFTADAFFGTSDPTTQTVRFCSLQMRFSGCPIPQLRLSDFVHCRCNLLVDEANQCYNTLYRPPILPFCSINLPHHSGNNVYSKPSLIRLQLIRIEI
jgi:hypothetical protein